MVRYIKRLPFSAKKTYRGSPLNWTFIWGSPKKLSLKVRLLSLRPLKESASRKITATQNISIIFFHRGDGDRGEEPVTCYHRRKKEKKNRGKQEKENYYLSHWCIGSTRHRKEETLIWGFLLELRNESRPPKLCLIQFTPTTISFGPIYRITTFYL